MENAVESILIAFAVLVFVIALSLTVYMLSKAMTTTESIIYNSDKTNYYQNIEMQKDNASITRQVGVETVFNSLYRYYKENFMVRIYDNTDKLLQVFDTTIEGKVYNANKKIHDRTDEEKALINQFGVGGVNLFGAPWLGNPSKDTKTRIDLYISGQKGYINNVIVDYENDGFYKTFTKDTKFEETFVEYMYSGEVITNGKELERLTGSREEKDKIIIIYKEV